MAVNNIPLAIGQKWKTRGGREAEIIGYDKVTTTEYVWNLSTENSVTDEGYYLSMQSPSDYDLITLIRDEHGFIPWNGGECPVAEDVTVEIKFCDGDSTKGFDDDFDWRCTGNGGDIVAYRVVQQEEQKYTVKEVFNALDCVITEFEHWAYFIDVVAHLAKTQDPEYIKYLELKAKFE